MPPPQLARDAPVVDVAHPFEVRLRILLRRELDVALLNRLDGLVRQRLNADKPLRRKPRLHHRLAAVALADGVHVVFHARPAGAAPPALRGPACAPCSDPAPRTSPAAAFMCAVSSITLIEGNPCRSPIAKSLGSCAGVTFTAPVPNSGSPTRRSQRESPVPSAAAQHLAVQVQVAFVVRVNGHCYVAQHRLRPRGRNRERSSTAPPPPGSESPKACPAAPRAPLPDRRARSGNAGTSSRCKRRDRSAPARTGGQTLRAPQWRDGHPW